jgi:tetratricopeptide (TPR) repeat protein
VCLLSLGKTQEALKVLEFILSEDSKHVEANTNIGFVYMQMGQNTMAYQYMKKAQELNPDYEQNLINLAVWYHNNHQEQLTQKTLRHLLKKHPDNEQAKAMLMDLQRL